MNSSFSTINKSWRKFSYRIFLIFCKKSCIATRAWESQNGFLYFPGLINMRKKSRLHSLFHSKCCIFLCFIMSFFSSFIYFFNMSCSQDFQINSRGVTALVGESVNKTNISHALYKFPLKRLCLKFATSKQVGERWSAQKRPKTLLFGLHAQWYLEFLLPKCPKYNLPHCTLLNLCVLLE